MSTELQQIGTGAFQNIRAMVEALKAARNADDSDAIEDAERVIHEDALSVQVRSGWVDVGAPMEAPAEYCILLSTGGPATRIVGELDEHGEPTSATLQAQDWGAPWTDTRGVDESVLLEYARCFCFAS